VRRGFEARGGSQPCRKDELAESVRIIAAMDEVLCIDSALLHFSRLLGRRTVSFWGRPIRARCCARTRAVSMIFTT